MNFKNLTPIFTSLLLAVVLLLGIATNLTVSANTLKPLKAEQINMIKEAKPVVLGSSTLDHYTFAAGVDGKVITGENGRYDFVLKTKSKTEAYTYENPITLYFKNVCKIGGRAVNATVNVDKIYNTAPFRTGSEADYKTLFYMTKYVFWTSNSSAEGNTGQNLTLSTVFTWADTGDKADIPFYQIVSDMDIDMSAYGDNLNEGWQGLSGYAGIIYSFTDYNYLDINLDQLKVQAKKGTTNFDGDESLLKGGVIVPASANTVQTFTDTWAGTSMEFYTPYDDRNIKTPTKTADNTDSSGEKMYDNGETIVWTVSQNTHTWNANLFSFYQNMKFVDTLPDEVEYHSAKLYHGDVDVTKTYGTLNYEADSKTVTYELNGITLNNPSFYDGKELKLVIETKAVNNGNSIISVTNNAYTVTDSVRQNVSKTVQVNYDIDLTVKKVWNDADDADGLRPDNIDVKLVTD